MRKTILGLSLLLMVGATTVQAAPPKQLKIVMARQSTVSPVDMMNDFSRECSNVSLTTNAEHSDFMLYAGGWSGAYRFMVIAHGGDTVFTTKTVLLSNAVKDVCKFLNTQAH